MFDHEKLDAYRLSIDFVAWVNALLDELSHRGRPSAVKHLDEASTSVALNERLLSSTSTSTSTSTSQRG